MAHDDPLKAKYVRVNLSLDSYHGAAFSKTANQYKLPKATLAGIWLTDPRNPITLETRRYYQETLEQLTMNDIHEYV